MLPALVSWTDRAPTSVTLHSAGAPPDSGRVERTNELRAKAGGHLATGHTGCTLVQGGPPCPYHRRSPRRPSRVARRPVRRPGGSRCPFTLRATLPEELGRQRSARRPDPAFRAGSTPETSAVWNIVDEWNRRQGEDLRRISGVRTERTTAKRRSSSDPEIGAGPLLSLRRHHGWRPLGVSDASGRERCLRNASKPGGEQPIRRPLALHGAPLSGDAWHFSRERRSSRRFPCARLSGYELGDDKLPSEFGKARKRQFPPSLHEKTGKGSFMKRRLPSKIDAWVKLASPHRSPGKRLSRTTGIGFEHDDGCTDVTMSPSQVDGTAFSAKGGIPNPAQHVPASSGAA